YTIMGVTDPAKKKALSEISTQSYVENNGHLFIFLADYHRHYELSKDKGTPIAYDKTEQMAVIFNIAQSMRRLRHRILRWRRRAWDLACATSAHSGTIWPK